MRKICTLFSVLAVAALSMLTFGCKEETNVDSSAAPRLAMTKDTVSVSFMGGNTAVNISASSGWKAATNDSWIEISPGEAPTGTRAMMLSVGENPDIVTRTGRVVVKSASLTDTLYIVQEGSPITDRIELDPAGSVTLAAGGESKAVRLWANIPWKAEGGDEWAVLSTRSGKGGEVTETLNISVGEWFGLEPRRTEVVFRGGMADDVVYAIIQEAFVPVITPSEVYLDFGSDGTSEKNTFTVTANTDWTAEADSWITFSPKSGTAGTTEVKVSVAPNEEESKLSGKIIFTAMNKTAEVVVEQEGLVKEPDNVTASVTQIKFAQDGSPVEGSTSNILANVDWTAALSAGADAWLTVTPQSGSKGVEAVMTFKANGANNTYDAFTATVTITAGEASETITVTQEGLPRFTTLPVSWEIKDNDPEAMVATSPRWGTPGANAYTSGTGEGIAYSTQTQMAYAQMSNGGLKSYTHTYIVAAEGHYAIKPLFTDDALTFHVPVEKLEAGTTLRFATGIRGVNTCPSAWIVEFWDNGKWNQGEGMSATAHNGMPATVLMTAQNTVYPTIATWTLQNDIVLDEVIVRVRCADGTWTVQGKSVSSPGSASTVRFTSGGGYKGPTIEIVE